MKTIKLLSQLEIVNAVLTTNALRKNDQVFLQQGTMDGACGPYCIFMALIILGVVNFEEATNLWVIDKRTRIGKLVKGMRAHSTLFEAGTHLNELETLIQQSFKAEIVVDINIGKGKSVIDYTIQNLKTNKPVVVGVIGKGLSHWLLAIGFEEDENGVATKILFLDPSGNSNSNYFNAIIGVNKTYHGYPYQWLDREDTYIKFDDAMSLSLL